MSVEKNMNTRIQHKHDIEANWNKAVNFIPRVGELIVYDVDDSYEYLRVKIGDGVRVISELPFITKEITNDFTDEYKFKVDSALQFETDPTVPAWAKATTKPAYTKSEVGLGNVDNVKQYSASNPPVVVRPDAPSDTSVIWVDTDDNTADEFQEAVNSALAQAKESGMFTPVKGTDYLTSADIENIVQQTMIALGKPVVGEVDANKNITLMGDLISGVYSVKYETAGGELINVGQIEIGGVAYKNWLKYAEEETSTALYNGKGWKENTRAGSDGKETSYNGIGFTGFIQAGNNSIIRVKSSIPVTNDYSNQSIALYGADKGFLYRLNWASLNTGNMLTINADGSIEYRLNAAYWTELAGKTIGFVRLSFPGINDDAIITINQEIV